MQIRSCFTAMKYNRILPTCKYDNAYPPGIISRRRLGLTCSSRDRCGCPGVFSSGKSGGWRGWFRGSRGPKHGVVATVTSHIGSQLLEVLVLLHTVQRVQVRVKVVRADGEVN